ncbi:MAG: hypothetical protein EDQ89_03835 [Acidobacteria bacterium]|nr:MAG: hypothetical protein EDQ89_03835 [Acidobacteriota bacterium]
MESTDQTTRKARVLFDEGHSEAWSIRPDVAERMQSSHPADSSLAAAAAALGRRDFEVAAKEAGPLDGAALADADVLVIAHPSEPEWEATTGVGEPRLSGAEIEAVVAWVEAGGGLVVLGETEQAKYGNNLNELLARFGIEIENATVQDYERHSGDAPSWILADLVPADGSGPDPLAGVAEACFYRAGTLALRNGGRVLARTSPTASTPRAPLAAVTAHGSGRVVVLADSDLFGDDCIGALDHEALWVNLVYYAAEPAFAAGGAATGSDAAVDPAWARLRDAVEELRARQSKDGSVDLATSGADEARLRDLAAEVRAAVSALAPRFPHQGEYFEALAGDLDRWVESGFAKPDFMASTDAFRPERDRRDGIEHLVVFPMYKQNGSPDTCFEALIVRVPWPRWVVELERRYDNAKYVPVELVEYTSGYDSECAVLFPETFSVAERPPAHFGAIFCDREAERLRRVSGAAAEILKLNLPPDAACLLASPELSRDAYIAWDLIHDRTHMRGDLPFDPFMIRQRSPYWMYSLEELRCDLTTFGEAVKLEAEGLALARHVQHAILFDRLFRFPLTGDRVRNYDGLGGQLLFAFLHHEGYLHWTDNRLEIDWGTVAAGVGRLRERVGELYHSGIDRSKLGQWIAAHDLVAAYVPPAEGSVWAADRRELPEVEEPKQLVDLVRDDEFPLSLFYSQLQPKLEPALAGRPARQPAAGAGT